MSVLAFTDEPALEIGLQYVLAEQPGFGFAGVCAAAEQFAGAAQRHQTHVILYSVSLDRDLAQLSSVRRAAPESAIVLWARDFSSELAHQAMEMGVRGFLSTTAPPASIVECLRFTATGEMWMERSLANTLLHWRPVGLSRRQTQLLGLLVQGLKNREIAAELGIAEGTVKAYLTTLFEKVGARDRFELALYGLKNLRNTREAEAGRDQRMRSQVRSRGKSSAKPGIRTA